MLKNEKIFCGDFFVYASVGEFFKTGNGGRGECQKFNAGGSGGLRGRKERGQSEIQEGKKKVASFAQ